MLVELGGTRRGRALELVLGASGVADPGAGVSIRMRAAPELTFEARRPDGKVETIEADASAALAEELAQAERALDAQGEEVRRLGERLEAARQAAAQARDEEAAAVAERGRPAPGMRPVVAADLTGLSVPARPPRRRGLFAWLLALVRRLLGRPAAPALPPSRAAVERTPPPDDVLERRIAALARHAATAARTLGDLEAEAAAAEARHAALAADCGAKRRRLAVYPEERRRRTVARVLALAAQPDASTLDLELGAPEVPVGLVLLLPALVRLWREPADATLDLDEVADAEALAEHALRLQRDRPARIARQVAAALCGCRNQIRDAARRLRLGHEERIAELAARRVAEPDARRRQEEEAAQLPVARHAEALVQEAATRLEKLLAEARADWEARIAACAGAEQLRAEVAAIESGAAHRLSVVCDELRETITLQCVRLVLELSRPLRQDLLARRLEVARGAPTQAEESFADIRVVLPASLETTFKALRAPDVGVLLPKERGLFHPLFRTLARDRRECVTRLGARLDEIERSTARELYAAAVYLSPLLAGSFRGIVDSLLGAHERWIDGRVDEAQRQYDAERERQQPALMFIPELEAAEARLVRLLETADP